MPYQTADNAQWERQTPERQHLTRFDDEPDYNCQRDEDGRREEPHYYEAPRRDERQHDSEHRDGYDSRDKPQPARASKPSDNARRTESDSDGQAPTLPTGKGKHARNLRNDAQTKEWEREIDERYEAKDSADHPERQAKRHTDQDPSYHSRSEDESPRPHLELPKPSGHDSEALRKARPLPNSPRLR